MRTISCREFRFSCGIDHQIAETTPLPGRATRSQFDGASDVRESTAFAAFVASAGTSSPVVEVKSLLGSSLEADGSVAFSCVSGMSQQPSPRFITSPADCWLEQQLPEAISLAVSLVSFAGDENGQLNMHRAPLDAHDPPFDGAIRSANSGNVAKAANAPKQRIAGV